MFGQLVRLQVFILIIVLSLGSLASVPLFSLENKEKKSEDKTDELFQMSLEELMNVKITTAGKTEEKISEIPASVVVITRQDIEKYGYQNLAEILENIPGLYQVDDYSFKNFGVRGFWTEAAQRNIVILVNDVPQTDHVMSAHLLPQINIAVEAIDRIEVVRGPMSVIYGTGAFFGVINIFTNQIDENNPINFASVSIGSEKTKKMFVRLSGKEGNFKYSFNGSYFDTDGIDMPFSDMLADPSLLPNFGLSPNQTTGGRLENEEKFFDFSGTFNNFTFNANYTEANKESAVIMPPVDEGTDVTYKKTRIYLKYAKEFSEKLKLEVKFFYFLNRMTVDYDMLVKNYYAVQNNQATGYKAELDLFYNPSTNFNIIIGLDYNRVTEAVNEYNFPGFAFNLWHHNLTDGEAIVTQSIFSQLKLNLSDKLKIVAGARVEQVPKYTWQQIIGTTDFENPTYTSTETLYSHTKIEFIPRVAFIYSVNDNNFLKFLYGKAINRPSFFHQVANLGATSTLKPETIQTFEINYIGSLSSKLSVSLSAFYNKMDSLIYRSMFLTEGGDLVSRFGNVGEMVTKGLELTINTRLFDNFHLELSSTYQETKDNRDEFKDIVPGYSPNFLGYLKASYFFNDDIILAITGSYVDDMESHYDVTLSPPNRQGLGVKSYFLLGANLRIKKIFGSGLFFNLRGSNLLDKKYRYPTTPNNQYFAYKGTFGRPISFLITVGWEF